ncbi:protein mono-ADP-ribosyltransferase PARP14-like isoform X2 [Sycon ciliatum]
MASLDEETARRTVLVRGLPQSVDEYELEAFFQSSKQGAQGDVESLTMAGQGRAHVTFEDPNDAQRVVSVKSHIIKGMQIKVEPYYPPTVHPAMQQPTAGLKPGSSQAGRAAVDSWTAKFNALEQGGRSEGSSGSQTASMTSGHQQKQQMQQIEDTPHRFFPQQLGQRGPVSQQQDTLGRHDGTIGFPRPRPQGEAHNIHVAMQETGAMAGAAGYASVSSASSGAVLQDAGAMATPPRGGNQTSNAGCTVVVSSAGKDLPDAETLEMYFESTRKSGGGCGAEVHQISTNIAHVKFESAETATRVSQREHQFKGVEMTVAILVAEEPAAVEEPSATILVSALPENVDEDDLEMYFDNKKRSGGGDVSRVEMASDGTEALVTFTDPAVAASVCERPSHVIRKQRVSVRRASPGEPFAAHTTGEPCLIVSGFTDSMDRDTLELYFESAKKSGGGEMADFIFNSDSSTAMIFFESPSVLQRAADRSHTLCNQRLQVESALGTRDGTTTSANMTGRDASAAQASPDSGEYETNKVILFDIPAAADEEHIKFYFGAAFPGRGVVQDMEIEPYPQNSRALITTPGQIDFPSLEKYVKEQKLAKENVSVRRVRRSNCLRLRNAVEVTADAEVVALVFKSSMQIDVDFSIKDGAFDVKFPSHHDAQRALSQQYKLRHKVLDFHPVIAGLDYPYDEGDARHFVCDVSDAQVVEVSVDRNYLRFFNKCTGSWQRLEERLRRAHSQIDVVDTPTPLLRVTPVEGKSGMYGWKKNATAALSDFLKGLSTVTFNVLTDVYKESVGNGRLQIALRQYQNIIVHYEEAEHSISLAGELQAVSAARNDAMTMLLEVETSLTERVDEFMKLRPVHRAFVEQVGILQRPDMSSVEMKFVKNGKNRGSLMVQGPRHHVKEISNKLLALTQQVMETRLVIQHPEAAALLASDLGQSYMMSVAKAFREDLETIVFVSAGAKENQIGLVGWNSDEQDLVEIKTRLEDSCTTSTIHLQPHEAETLSSSEWRTLLAEMKKQYLVEITNGSVRDSDVMLCGVNVHFAAVKGHIAEFMLEHAVLSANIEISVGEERCIKTYMRDDVASVKKQCMLPRVDVSGTAITFRGNVRNVQKAKEAFGSLLKRIFNDCFQVQKPGIQQLFQNSKTIKHLKDIESSHKVIIQSGNATAEGTSGEAGAAASQTLVEGTLLPSGGLVRVVRGDITRHSCDAVVNAANDRLQHVGGVARALVQRGGRSIQDECDKVMRGKAALQPGEVVCTKPGTLDCKLLIHAVGPRFHNGYSGEEKDLEKAARNCLQAAAKNKCRSVAMPAISTGVFGYPSKDAAIVLLRTVVDYLKNNGKAGSVKEVHFVDQSPEIVDTFKALISNGFPASQVHYPGMPSSRGISASGHGGERPGYHAEPPGAGSRPTRKQGGGNKPGRRGRSARSQQTVQPGAPPFEAPPSGISQVRTTEQKTIIVRQGDLCQEQADVLVNTAAKNLNLSNGLVAKALLTAAGQSLQTECTTYVQTYGDVPVGGFAATGGHGLTGCKFIFHSVGDHYSHGKGSQSLQDMVMACLIEANSRGLTSIVFPSLGAGNLGFPPAESAQLMFNAAQAFSQQHPNGSLTEIRFVIFDNQVLQAFHAEAFKHSSPSPSAAAEMDPGELEHLPMVNTRSAAAAAAATGPVYIQKDSDVLCGKVPRSSVQLHLFKGDIVKENADAVIVSVDSSLDLSKGIVSKRIVEIAGASIQQQCRDITQQGQLQSGSVVQVDGGKFCKHLVLAVCADHSSGVDLLEDTVYRALKAADQCRATRVAMPALGTGILGFTPRDSAEAIVRALKMFAPQAQSVQVVRLPLYDDKSLRPFQDEVNDELDQVVIARDDSLLAAGKRLMASFGLTTGSNPSAPPSAVAAANDAMAAFRSSGRYSVEEEPLVLNVYSLDRGNMKKAMTNIQSLCDDNYRTTDLSQDTSALRDSDLEKILGFQQKLNIHLQISQDKVVISGDKEGVVEAKGQLMEIINSAKMREMELKHATSIAKSVQWCYKTAGSSLEQNYSLTDNMHLEEAYQDYMTRRGPVLGKIAGTTRREVDFRTMKELVNSQLTAVVIRNDLTKKDLTPSHWDLKAGGTLVQLTKSDPEYQKVEQLFRRTAGQQVTKIERIQVPGLYAQYQTKKTQMENNPQSTSKSNELRLFHGTDATTVSKVIVQGFNRSFAGKHATKYGKGVYFARDASYSVSYSQASGGPIYQMFQVMVLAGDYAVGSQNLLQPPLRPNSQVDVLDSTVDNVGNPSIYVTYHDSQAYPEYLITFQ